MLLLLLSHFSRVRLCAIPQTAAHQAPLCLGFSRQEHWSGLPFPSPIMKVKSESEVAQLCPTLRNPMDCSLPGSSVHGIFQARVLEWVAISFFKCKCRVPLILVKNILEKKLERNIPLCQLIMNIISTCGYLGLLYIFLLSVFSFFSKEDIYKYYIIRICKEKY